MNNFFVALSAAIIAAAIMFSMNVGGESSANTSNDTNNKSFVYKSDPRSFQQRPNNDVATRKGWTEDDDLMVLIAPKSKHLKPFYIDAFEAMISDHRAWSVPGEHPTDKIRYRNAETACIAAGKRLCYKQEWQAACRGGYVQPVEFQRTDSMMQDCYFAKGQPYTKTDIVEKTDSHMACTPAGLALFHMVGNVAEFVKSERGQVMVMGLTYYDVHIKDRKNALKYACERIVYNEGQYPPEKYNKGLGFRCCKNANSLD